MQFPGSDSPQENFRLILMTVVGQAYTAAGYHLEETPVQWAGGQYRFHHQFEDGLHGFIVYQLLSYSDSEWSSGAPSRFRVTLTRSDLSNPSVASEHILYESRSLSALVVEDFGVEILPSADYWWTYRDIEELGQALAEAGHLVIGYGIPWLANDLIPPE